MSARSEPIPPQAEQTPGAYILLVPWDLEHPGGVNPVVMTLYDEQEAKAPG